MRRLCTANSRNCWTRAPRCVHRVMLSTDLQDTSVLYPGRYSNSFFCGWLVVTWTCVPCRRCPPCAAVSTSSPSRRLCSERPARGCGGLCAPCRVAPLSSRAPTPTPPTGRCSPAARSQGTTVATSPRQQYTTYETQISSLGC